MLPVLLFNIIIIFLLKRFLVQSVSSLINAILFFIQQTIEKRSKTQTLTIKKIEKWKLLYKKTLKKLEIGREIERTKNVIRKKKNRNIESNTNLLLKLYEVSSLETQIINNIDESKQTIQTIFEIEVEIQLIRIETKEI